MPFLCFLIGLRCCGVEGLALSGTLLPPVAPGGLDEAVDWSESRFFCRTGAMMKCYWWCKCDSVLRVFVPRIMRLNAGVRVVDEGASMRMV